MKQLLLKIGVTSLALLAFSVPAAKAALVSGPYSVNGWVSWSNTIIGVNDGILINLPNGAIVTGLDYSDISFQSVYPSWASQARLGLFELDGVGGWDDSAVVSFDMVSNTWGTFGPYSGSWGDPGSSGSVPFVVDNGTGDLWLTVFDALNDNGDGYPDTVYVSGTVNVYYTVPEPSAAALGLVGLGLTFWRRRRAW